MKLYEYTFTEYLKKLDELAEEIKGNAEKISEALDEIEPAQAEKFKETTIYKLVLNTLGKTCIHDIAYACEVVNYFEALIVYLLPLRLHDSSYLAFINDELFHNGNDKKGSKKTNWLYDDLIMKSKMLEDNSAFEVMNKKAR